MLEDAHLTALSLCRTRVEVSRFSDECLNKHKYTPNIFQEEHAVTSAFGFESNGQMRLRYGALIQTTSAPEHTKNSSWSLLFPVGHFRQISSKHIL